MFTDTIPYFTNDRTRKWKNRNETTTKIKTLTLIFYVVGDGLTMIYNNDTFGQNMEYITIILLFEVTQFF